MPSVDQVLEALQTVLEDPSEVTRGRLWAMAFVEELDVRTVREYVEEDKSLLPILVNHLHLENDLIRPTASDAVAITWNSIQKYIGDIERLRGLMISESKDPAMMRRILHSREGTDWLNKRMTEVFHYLYELGWGE